MTCPVETMTIQAADILRAMKALGHPQLRDAETAEWEQADFPIVKAMASDGASAAGAIKALFRELGTVSEAAAVPKAKTAKGALFQAYLGAEIGSAVTGYIRTTAIEAPDLARAQDAESRADRLLRSAISRLETVTDLDRDADLQILRRWFLDPERDPQNLIAELIQKVA